EWLEELLSACGHVQRGQFAGAFPYECAPSLRGLDLGVDRCTRGLTEQMGPGSWHHVHEPVATTTEQEPATTRGLLRERVQLLIGASLPVHTQRQVRQRVEGMGVTSLLSHQDLGLELVQQGWNDRVEGPMPATVTGARRQGDVDRVPFCVGTTDLRGVPRPGKKRRR